MRTAKAWGCTVVTVNYKLMKDGITKQYAVDEVKDTVKYMTALLRRIIPNMISSIFTTASPLSRRKWQSKQRTRSVRGLKAGNKRLAAK